MDNAFYNVPSVDNEPVRDYEKGSVDRELLKKQYNDYISTFVDIPMYIGNDLVYTENKRDIRPPHQLHTVVGSYNYGDKSHVTKAIDEALLAKNAWSSLSWEHRASIFLKAADLLSSKYRYKINAGTMLCQSKNAFQAEIDAVCEFVDFLRYNVSYLTQIYKEQPSSSDGIWNRMQYRPLEGFVFAITPFNFTAIAANLCVAPALMGNVVVWKPADTQIYTANIIMEVFREAGLPNGVINMVTVDGGEAGSVVFEHPDFSGLHFTGSTKVFKKLWGIIGQNISKYKTYPRIVGETGGKDYILAHESADVSALATAIVRGGFEYQGQKCSAASRVYVPKVLWEKLEGILSDMIANIKVGPVDDFSNFVNALIDRKAFDRVVSYIEYVKEASDAKIIAGGQYESTEGYFVSPTVILTSNPKFKTMEEEIFGPVVTIYVYDEKAYNDVLSLVDSTSKYALTGAIFCKDRYILDTTMKALVNSAGNLYINDKPTGAVVNQQPFGGARDSGTNDKAGSKLNLLRWVSAMTIKETLNPPTNYTYPFMLD